MNYKDFVKNMMRNRGPWNSSAREYELQGAILEMSEEAGEVLSIYNKASRKRSGRFTDEDLANIWDEASDVLFGLTAICNWYGSTIEDLQRYNQDKLETREKDRKLHSDPGANP